MKRCICIYLMLICFLTGCSDKTSDIPVEGLEIIKVFTPEEAVFDYSWSSMFTTDTVCYKFTYQSDNETVVGYLAKPEETTEKLPILIHNRGGNREFGKWTDSDICYLAYLYAQYGYIVLASQYRGVDGGTGTEQFGGDDVNDILNLIEVAKQLPCADADSVFLYGTSRGGMMTYQVCRNNTDPSIKAAVINSGSADLYMAWDEREELMRDVMRELIGGAPQELPEEYDKRSATKWADEINVPLLILHSAEDWRVSYGEALTMVELLEKYDKEHKFITYEGDLHGEWELGLADVYDWFEKYK